MKPTPVDLPIIWRGSDYAAILFNWKDGNGNPFNLTGWNFYAQTQRFDLNGTIRNAQNGITQIALGGLVTATLNLGVNQWNCWFRSPNGIISPPLLAGKVEVKEKILKP